MRKRFSFFLLIVGISFLLCAFDWPPEPYDMPRTLLTADLFGNYLGGLFNSIRAIGSMGFVITMILSSVFIIPSFFFKYILKDYFRKQAINQAVDKKEFARSVRAADREKNRQSIIDDKVADMEIHQAARKQFRELYPEADLEERIYQKELSYSAQISFLANHPELKKRRRR